MKDYFDIEPRIVTFNPQKDGRVVLGTAVHKFPDCRTLKKRETINIAGCSDLVNKFPKCSWCFNRTIKNGQENT